MGLIAYFNNSGWIVSHDLQVDEHRVVSVPYQSVKVLSGSVFADVQ